MSEMSSSAEPLARRKPGRPPRQAAPTVQEPVVQARPRRDGRIEAKGRDGAVLSRRRAGNTDPYAVPPNIVPDGWVYQWNAVTVHGSADPVSNQTQTMWLNGWRPVPADRHDGLFMPVGVTGAIVRGGLRLEERPKELNDEARAEEKAIADGQMRDQSAQFGLAGKLGRGFDERKFNGRSRAEGNGIRTGIDAAVDVPRPQYEIDQT